MESYVIVYVLAEEAGTGHGGDAYFLCQPFAELNVILDSELRSVHKNIVSSLGVVVAEAKILKSVDKNALFALIYSEEIPVIVVSKLKGGNNGFHKRMSRADRKEVMHLFSHVYYLVAGKDISKTPSGDGVGL